MEDRNRCGAGDVRRYAHQTFDRRQARILRRLFRRCTSRVANRASLQMRGGSVAEWRGIPDRASADARINLCGFCNRWRSRLQLSRGYASRPDVGPIRFSPRTAIFRWTSRMGPNCGDGRSPGMVPRHCDEGVARASRRSFYRCATRGFRGARLCSRAIGTTLYRVASISRSSSRVRGAC